MKIIFACVHNAGRSQMAAAFFNKFADPAKALAISAGTQPAPQVHDSVIEVMKEVEIDLSEMKPQLLTEKLASGANVLVTMGCGEACPHVANLKREDWPFGDPKGKSLDEVREIRQEILARIIAMLTSQSLLRR